MHNRMYLPGRQGMHEVLGGYSPIWMILFWIVLAIFLIYLIFQFINSRKKPSNENQTPLQTLKQRLAQGEIDEEEYRRLKSIIEQDN